MDDWARRRCQTLLSVDDTYVQLLQAVEKLGQDKNTFVLVSSDHGRRLPRLQPGRSAIGRLALTSADGIYLCRGAGYNLGNHMLYNAKMQFCARAACVAAAPPRAGSGGPLPAPRWEAANA